jgi:hypothetical protein
MEGMEGSEYKPPPSVVCPRCGAPAAWQPPARRAANEGWEADFLCENSHRLQLLSKPKRRRESAG